MNGIAERMKRAREAAGLTQPQLAARAGVSQGTIGNLETGLRKRPRDLLSIAAALGVDPHWLETGRTSSRLSGSEHGPGIDVQPDLPQSLKRIASALQHSDDLTLDQVRPLLTRLVDTPERAQDIVPRLASLLTPDRSGFV